MISKITARPGPGTVRRPGHPGRPTKERTNSVLIAKLTTDIVREDRQSVNEAPSAIWITPLLDFANVS